MAYYQVCSVTVKLLVSVSANLDVKTIGIGLSVKSTIGLALLFIMQFNTINLQNVSIHSTVNAKYTKALSKYQVIVHQRL